MVRFYARNWAVLGVLGLAGQDAHQRFNGQQRGCIVAQIGAGIHDGVDLFDS